jgi:rhomboid protease GluP
MASGSRICAQCGALNSVDEKTCHRCGKRMSGPLGNSARGLFADFSADGLPVTKLMALMCIVVYALMMVTNGGFKLDLSLGSTFKLSTLLRYGVLYSDLAYAEPWRLLASVFIHLGLLHIGLNMMSLVSLGKTLEPHLGSARFMILYVATGILGFVASQWWYGSNSYTAGASGAIFGLVGGFVGVLMARRHPNWKRALTNNLIYCGILSFVLPANTAAHIGGFLSGLAIGALFEREKQPHRREGVMRVIALVCLVACVGSIVLSARSPIWKLARQAEEAQRIGQDSE